jgi:hypothetical protein
MDSVKVFIIKEVGEVIIERVVENADTASVAGAHPHAAYVRVNPTTTAAVPSLGPRARAAAALNVSIHFEYIQNEDAKRQKKEEEGGGRTRTRRTRTRRTRRTRRRRGKGETRREVYKQQ